MCSSDLDWYKLLFYCHCTACCLSICACRCNYSCSYALCCYCSILRYCCNCFIVAAPAYVLAFDTVKDSYLYSLDYANSAKEWTQVGTNSITDKGVNNASLCFDGDNVYVGTTASDNITFVSGLVDGEWQQLGTNVSIQDISGLNISYGNSKIYATYLDSDTGKAVVRSYEVKSADKPEQPVEVPITEVQLGREALDMYEGDTFLNK